MVPLPLLTEREALERLEVAGATFFTPDVLPDCVTLRLELWVPLLTLRLELALPLLTLRLELVLALLTLRDVEALATLRLEEVFSLLPSTDLEAAVVAAWVTLRSLLEPENARRSVVERLRFLSHPPLLILLLGVNPANLSSTTRTGPG